MPKEWIDVADSAVKIGLGALISGVFTYVGLKFSKQSEMNKFSIEHKTKLLEELSGNIEEYFSFWDIYVAQVGGIARNRARLNKENSELTKPQKETMAKRNSDLVSSWPLREKAVAKLRLINATAAAEELLICKELEKEFRDPIVFEKLFPEYNAIEAYREKTKDQKLKVHKNLASFYETIHT